MSEENWFFQEITGPVWKRVRTLKGGLGNTVPITSDQRRAVAEAINNYRYGDDINGQSPEEFRNNLRTGWAAAGFDGTQRDSDLWRRALFNELSVIDIAAQSGLTKDAVNALMNHDLPLVYHLYMTPDQQSDFHSWATNEQKFEVTNTIGTARLDALQKKKDAEWKAIRAEIDKGDYNHNLGQYGSADPDACKREFFHEENVGTTGYVPRHVLPITTHPMEKPCNKRTGIIAKTRVIK